MSAYDAIKEGNNADALNSYQEFKQAGVDAYNASNLKGTVVGDIAQNLYRSANEAEGANVTVCQAMLDAGMLQCPSESNKVNNVTPQAQTITPSISPATTDSTTSEEEQVDELVNLMIAAEEETDATQTDATDAAAIANALATL